MTTVVTGVFRDRARAEAAISDLVAAGFPRADLSVILRSTPEHERRIRAETEDAPHGALLGAIAGGAFASLAFGALALSGVGLIAAGPLLAALTAGGAGAAAGGVVGALVGHGISSQVADEYETALEAGYVLVVVHTLHRRMRDARSLLVRNGAQNLFEAVHPARHEATEGS